MTFPAVPSHFQKEGPASPCVLNGANLTWKNCTVLSCAMGMSKSSIGRVEMSGCQVRAATNDHEGGTTIPQVEAICSAHGIPTEAHTGSNVASLYYLAYQCSLGRGFILQGNTQPDGRGNVNHAVWVNQAIGGTPGNPVSFDVWDPWSNGAATWSYAKTKEFMLALRPWGEGDSRTLKNMGVNGGYALVFPDTEPHFHSHYGGSRSAPFPNPATIHSPVAGRRVNVRTRPDRLRATDIAGTLATGARFNIYQVTNGIKPPGSNSRTWYGNHNGDRWVHSSGVLGGAK